MSLQQIVQVSIDTRTIEEGIRQTKIAIAAGADWIEVGTPLVTHEGMSSIDALVSLVDTQEVLVDYKALDGVDQYFIETKKRGASIATVMALTNDFSIKKAVSTAKDVGVKVMLDMFSYPIGEVATRAKQMEDMGADYLLVHLGIDEFRDPCGGKDPLVGLDEIASVVNIPIGVVVFTAAQAKEALVRGAKIIVVGTPIIESPTALEDLSKFITEVKQV